MYAEQGYLRSKSSQKRAGLDVPELSYSYFEKINGEPKAKILSLSLAFHGSEKLKKRPVFFTHFCLCLTWFFNKIKPFVIGTFHLRCSLTGFTEMNCIRDIIYKVVIIDTFNLT